MAYIDVACSYCRKNFPRKKGQFNEAQKFGWKQYCSAKCQFIARLAGENKICQNCNKEVWRTPRDINNNLTGRFFCSHSCSAKFNNHLRVLDKEPLKICKAENCNNLVKDRHCLYCSRKCGSSIRKRAREEVMAEVINSIKKFHGLNGRIPVKKEKYDMYKKARNMFGTWNKAIEAAGYKPNPVMFANKYTATDGHQCDSMAEMMVDDWLHSRGIPHDRSIPYPEFNKLTCNFVVSKTFIEYFGLEGELEEYDKLVNLKRKLSKKHKFKLIGIKPSDLFPKNKLDKVLRKFI